MKFLKKSNFVTTPTRRCSSTTQSPLKSCTSNKVSSSHKVRSREAVMTSLVITSLVCMLRNRCRRFCRPAVARVADDGAVPVCGNRSSGCRFTNVLLFSLQFFKIQIHFLLRTKMAADFKPYLPIDPNGRLVTYLD